MASLIGLAASVIRLVVVLGLVVVPGLYNIVPGLVVVLSLSVVPGLVVVRSVVHGILSVD